jgi:hypothetical protein
MEWLDKLTQHTLFPGQYIYRVCPIFNEYDIQKVRVLDITFSIGGLQSFYYTSEPGGSLHHWSREYGHYMDQSFFHTVQEAIDWCQKQGNAFTVLE